jgi:putative ABC transport system substrate-binding protein
MQRTRRTLLVHAAAFFAAALAAGAQPAAKPPTIGFLGAGTRSTWSNRVARFEQRLHELGWIAGRTIRFEYRWADGHPERLVEIASEFVRLNVAVIVTAGHTAIIAAKKATSIIPIVFAAAGDPVGSGIVASLARPGGNVTGFSVQQAEAAGKRLELLRTLAPGFRRLAMLVILANPLHVSERSEVVSAARSLGIDVTMLEIRGPDDIVPALETIKTRVDALYVPPDPIVISKLTAINTVARVARLPSIHGSREYVEAGGLMSYGPDFLDLFARAADYVDRILRGANPGELPIEQPRHFEFVISLKTAKALRLTVPSSLLLRADQVIE